MLGGEEALILSKKHTDKKVDALNKSTSTRLMNVEETAHALLSMNINNEEVVTQTTQKKLSVLPKNVAERPLKVEYIGQTLVNLLGKLIKEHWEQGGINSTTGINESSPTRIRRKDSITVTPNSNFHLRAFGNFQIIIYEYDSNGNFLKHSGWLGKNGKVKLSSNTTSIKVSIRKHDGVTDLGMVVSEVLQAYPLIYTIDQSTYDKIGVSLTDADVERLFPYVDGVQHVQNPMVRVEGSNLIPPFTDKRWNLHANAKVISPYELELNATATLQITSIPFSVVKGQPYTFEIKVSGNAPRWNISNIVNNVSNPDSYGGAVQSSSKIFTFIPTADVIYVNIYSNATGLHIFSQLMLTLGDKPKPFAPHNPTYQYSEVTLAGNHDKKDILSYNYENRRWEKIKWWERDVVLDGRWDWSFQSNFTGFKIIRVNKSLFDEGQFSSAIVTKYNSSMLSVQSSYSAEESDVFMHGGGSNTTLRISISNSDTGWADGYTPTVQDIKNYLNSKPYKLTYQRATPEIIPIKEIFGTPIASHSHLTFDHILGKADLYTANGIVENGTYSEIIKVNKIDTVTFQETDITKTCTLNAGKNGFTSTALKNGDLVWYELRMANTAIGELKYSYYDSRFVINDATNGKTYKYKVKSNNGTPSIVLEEV